jgi:hypothetical protein
MRGRVISVASRSVTVETSAPIGAGNTTTSSQPRRRTQWADSTLAITDDEKLPLTSLNHQGLNAELGELLDAFKDGKIASTR